MSLFVTCAQGLESLLSEELEELGYHGIKPGFRGVFLNDITMETIMGVNYRSRLAGRVLLPLSQFRCYDQRALYKGVEKIDWSAYLTPETTFAIDANVNHPKLRNSLFAAQVAKDAICDQLRQKTGARPSIETKNPDVQLNLFIHQNEAIFSFDTSGYTLHKRGYRLDAGEAPLQESLAAGLLRIAKYSGSEILLDPCCGSGTILIEAALMATNTPPGYLRRQWGFQRLPAYSQESWLKIKSEADDKKRPLQKGLISGCEINKNVALICRNNLRAAGFHQEIEVVRMDFREFEPQVPPDLLITNPPHGKRLEEVDTLKPLYRALGDFMKRKMAKPGRGFVFTGSLELAKEVGLAPKRRHVMDNSGIESRLLEFDIF